MSYLDSHLIKLPICVSAFFKKLRHIYVYVYVYIHVYVYINSFIHSFISKDTFLGGKLSVLVMGSP